MSTQLPERKTLHDALVVLVPDAENRKRVMALADAYADQRAARELEEALRPPLVTRPRGFGGKDFSEAHRRPAS